MQEINKIFGINQTIGIPIYKQLIESVISGIENKTLKKGDQIPSINEVSSELRLAKGTVAKAYNELKAKGIIISIHGKGFYIDKSKVKSDFNIFMIFDQINPFKQIIYDAFVKELGVSTDSVTIFYHHSNYKIFASIINDNIGKFNYYVIMPHLTEDVSGIVKKLPKDRTLIIDNEVKQLADFYPTICQAFENDMYACLTKSLALLKKYNNLTLILSKKNFQFIPNDNILGFEKFCANSSISYTIADDLEQEMVNKGASFIVYSDNDLIALIKICRTKNLKLGTDIGLISYDDTPMKEILEGGITTISTDFQVLGQTAARMIREKSQGRFENPCRFIERGSL